MQLNDKIFDFLLFQILDVNPGLAKNMSNVIITQMFVLCQNFKTLIVTPVMKIQPKIRQCGAVTLDFVLTNWRYSSGFLKRSLNFDKIFQFVHLEGFSSNFGVFLRKSELELRKNI